MRICRVEDIPPLGARVCSARVEDDIALFRTPVMRCMPWSTVARTRAGRCRRASCRGNVTCPLHNWNIALVNGAACAPDVGCARKFPVRVEAGEVWLSLHHVRPRHGRFLMDVPARPCEA